MTAQVFVNRAQRPLMSLRFKPIATLILFFASIMSVSVSNANGVDYNVLEECMKLSNDDTDINNCLDNYLDLMDDNMRDITAYIGRDLPDAALDQFQKSQTAFMEYRKQNCLWYLEFSSPRSLAEKIAKNCLSTHTQGRLAELQALIATDRGKADTLRGFYVYGANRNSFQPCGSGQRYWVEGDGEQVGQLQQDYISRATSPLQVLYAELRGQIASDTSYPDHSGFLQLASVILLKPPSDSECSLPNGTTDTTLANAPEIKPPMVQEPEPVAQIEEPVEAQPAANDDSEQVFRAYFGDWLAECKQGDSSVFCELSVGFSGEGVTEDSKPQMSLSRRSDKRTTISMRFPEREIDSPTKIRWRVDKFVFGDIVGSDIRVDESGTRQLVRERKFIRDDLMPLFRDGNVLGVEVLGDVDDKKGDRYSASLDGLTRALSFADDFVANGGEL